MKKAVVFNLGCKTNQYECDVLAAGLKSMGYETSDRLEYADVYIVNTCAVTSEAERKSRQILSRIRAHNPQAYIAICGCASQKNAEFFLKNGVQYVSGVAGKTKLLEYLGQNHSAVDELPSAFEETEFLPSVSRTRGFVKIQDGCSNFCSYCIIPHLRGAPRSKKIAAAAEEIRALSKSLDEIVITGINLSFYGKDNGESLAALMREIKDVDVRVRLGSFYVEGISAELLDALFSLKDFCPHFHLSLQNGDDGVLKDMNRRYTTADYKEKVKLIRRYDPLAAITTDIIVGYPTETEESFQNTLNFVKEVGFSDIHIFPFSAREGTKAAKLKPLDPKTVKDRAARLAEVRDGLCEQYLKKMLGAAQNVIIEETKDGIAEGYSQYYVRCYTPLKTPKKRVIIILDELYKDGIKGSEKEMPI